MRSAMLLLFLMPLAAQAQCVFWVGSYQHGGPWTSHVFAVAAFGDERRCISWMPQERFRLPRGSVPGVNWTLGETLAHTRRLGVAVRWDGPFRAGEEFWGRFCRRVEELESGAVRYQALDGQRLAGAANCQTAVIGITGTRPPTGLRYGYRAGTVIAEYLRREP